MTSRRLWAAGSPELAELSDVDHARRSIERVPLGDDALERDRLLMMELVGDRADIALRTARPGHLTGSAFVVDASCERGLLLFHTKLQRWLQPGGHADGDMNLAAVALKEASEESGIEGLEVYPEPIDLDIHRVAPPEEDAHLHLDVRFLVVAPPGAQPVGNAESQALRWVSDTELDAYDIDLGLQRLAATAFGVARTLRRHQV